MLFSRLWTARREKTQVLDSFRALFPVLGSPRDPLWARKQSIAAEWLQIEIFFSFFFRHTEQYHFLTLRFSVSVFPPSPSWKLTCNGLASIQEAFNGSHVLTGNKHKLHDSLSLLKSYASAWNILKNVILLAYSLFLKSLLYLSISYRYTKIYDV